MLVNGSFPALTNSMVTAIQQMVAKGLLVLYADGTAADDDNDGGQQGIFLNLSSFPS